VTVADAAILAGCAAAPRWFDLSMARFPAYLDWIAAAGARVVELVVHHGPITPEGARVHLEAADWPAAVQACRERGIAVVLHAPLDERFRLDRFASDPTGLLAELDPILDLLTELEQTQGRPSLLVLHGAGDRHTGRTTTVDVVRRLAGDLARRGATAGLALELRTPLSADDRRFDRSRSALAAFVDELALPHVGICWDVANDWRTAELLGRDYALPDASFLARVLHVHLHDANEAGLLHAPLHRDAVPWRAARDCLRDAGWRGAVTLEIRYRLAAEIGEPWEVLRTSLQRFLARS
jgi:sugar phosphate isomerase/epimerase